MNLRLCFVVVLERGYHAQSITRYAEFTNQLPLALHWVAQHTAKRPRSLPQPDDRPISSGLLYLAQREQELALALRPEHVRGELALRRHPRHVPIAHRPPVDPQLLRMGVRSRCSLKFFTARRLISAEV